jgi:hypothetical protein
MTTGTPCATLMPALASDEVAVGSLPSIVTRISAPGVGELRTMVSGVNAEDETGEILADPLSPQ